MVLQLFISYELCHTIHHRFRFHFRDISPKLHILVIVSFERRFCLDKTGLFLYFLKHTIVLFLNAFLFIFSVLGRVMKSFYHFCLKSITNFFCFHTDIFLILNRIKFIFYFDQVLFHFEHIVKQTLVSFVNNNLFFTLFAKKFLTFDLRLL